MAGIYLHIPFCRRKCHYCNFFSVASGKYRDSFTEILKKEILLQKDYLSGEEISTIYFGGGTPSMLKAQEMDSILSEIRRYHPVPGDAEITVEANPDDINPGKLREMATSGINRLSIGIQSFFDEDLRYLNRLHGGMKAELSVIQAQDAGFTNLSIDLIYGIPGLTNEKWEDNIRRALELNVPHISAYALTVEPGTALDVMIRRKVMAPVDDEQSAEQFDILTQRLKEAGYLHYEISNFCRDGHFSRHNSSYWKGVPYLGLGPSAHSYDGNSRQWNVASVSEYVDKVTTGDIYFEKEILTDAQKYNEYVMVTLRTMWGCDVQKIREDFGETYAEHFLRGIKKFQMLEWVTEKEGVFYIEDEGKFFSDGIAADLFID